MKPFSFLVSPLHSPSSGFPEGQRICSGGWRPAVDVYQRPNAVVLVVELAGVARDCIEVSVEGDLLSITGSREMRAPEGVTHVHQMEIPHGPFVRTVRLPEEADVEHIEAKFDQGFLTIEIPRKGTR